MHKVNLLQIYNQYFFVSNIMYISQKNKRKFLYLIFFKYYLIILLLLNCNKKASNFEIFITYIKIGFI